MKRLIALVLAASPAWALTPDLKTNLTDLMYIPAAGTFYGKTSFGMSMMEGDIGSDDFTYDTNTVSQEVRYGISERWQVFASYTELLTGDFEVKTATATLKDENIGADRPELGLLWRVGNPSDYLLTSDVYLSYAPSIGDERYTLNNDAVQGPRDGDAIVAGSRFGRKFDKFEFTMDLRFTFHGESDILFSGTPSDTTYEAESHVATWFGGSVQVPVTESLWVKGGVHFTRVSSYSAELKTGGGDITVGPRHSTIVNLGAIWAMTPDRLALALDLGYEMLGDRYLSAVNYENFNEMSAVASARYQF